LVGLPRTEAEATLKGADLRFKTTLAIVGNVGKSLDRVILSNPAEGERLGRGKEVRLFIGKPTNMYQCPDQEECVLAGNLPVEAQKAIQANMERIEQQP